MSSSHLCLFYVWLTSIRANSATKILKNEKCCFYHQAHNWILNTVIGCWSIKLSVMSFKYPHRPKPGLINLKLFLTFRQAVIIQKSYRSQNLWSAWLTGYQRAEHWLKTTVCVRVCVCGAPWGLANLHSAAGQWQVLMLGREVARASVLPTVITLTDLQKHTITHTHSHTQWLGLLITALQRQSVCVCWIDFSKDSSSVPAGLPSKPSMRAC